ncbi:MAG TPA: Hsp20/alpha crystallin family protein [Patescibacteria group bacterium]|nr:Hsp20/alpha crystallin family protein [Patescibacteria group bacterium]
MRGKTLSDEHWLPEQEGQLSVDVLEDLRHLYVRTAIAGVRAEDLDISVTHDTVTIRGRRVYEGVPETGQAEVHVQECHWGPFSRSIVLPVSVHAEEADAVLKKGILTITLPKAEVAAMLRVVGLD